MSFLKLGSPEQQ